MGLLTSEKFYTAGEVAKIWRVSTAKVLAEFRRRPGVFRTGPGARPHLRIPESLVLQVMKERGYVADDEERNTNARK